jgi:hypothetical protein
MRKGGYNLPANDKVLDGLRPKIKIALITVKPV